MPKEVAESNVELELGSLRVRLKEWTIWHEACWHLGQVCGIWGEADDYEAFCRENGAWWWRGMAEMDILASCLDKLAFGRIISKRKGEVDNEYIWGRVRQLPAASDKR